MDNGSPHLLSLKVMRVSRPGLASAWQPFYSSSPSFSAHSTASITSLQGTTPLPGHPKTLRDLTHASELLTLPSAFGSIQLGETFASCLCINNEAQIDINDVSMKVEMQTATAKVVLAEIGGPEHQLLAGDTLEHVINHEIKELGQHVLACSVTYKLPSNARSPNSPNGDAENVDDFQTFRKFYKFAVTNPLSVKTKVHTPRSPTALMSPTERDKVFLEVHIQNLTQEPMLFERMQFECAEGWEVTDANVVDIGATDEHDNLFSGSMALMQPQDTRQYIYIISPKFISLAPVVYTPGSVIPLGRLDIAWRSSFGEPGRLLTSVLSRRIPLPPVPIQPPASALPSHLKRSVIGSPPSRPQSPHTVPSRPGTPPPLRPDSPPRNRPSSVGPARPQSPFQSSTLTAQSSIEVNLIIRANPLTPIKLQKPFTIPFSIILSAPSSPGKRQRRVARVAVQHLQPPCKGSLAPPLPPPPPEEAFSPRFPSSGFSTPSSNAPTFNYALAHQKILMASPRQAHDDVLEQDRGESDNGNMVLPPPVFISNQFNMADAPRPCGAKFIGSSVVLLPPVELMPAGQEIHGHRAESFSKLYAVQEFDLSYLPTQTGYAAIGGLRVLLLDDKNLDEDESWNDSLTGKTDRASVRARVLEEWEVIADIWVSS